MKNVQKRSGAVGNVFLCIQKCIRTDGAPWSEPHIFHTHFKSSVSRVGVVSLVSRSRFFPSAFPDPFRVGSWGWAHGRWTSERELCAVTVSPVPSQRPLLPGRRGATWTGTVVK